MKYGLIFDVDGTILDSFDAIYYSLDTVLKRYGVLDFSREELRSLMDYMSFMEIIRFLMEKYNVDNESMAELSSQYVNYFIESIKTIMRPFPGIIDLIHDLSFHFTMGIISYNPTFILQEQVRHFSLDRYFKFIRGYEEIDGKKRNGINEFSRLYDIDKGKIAFIGDQPKDIIEAKAAGVISIAVSYGISRIDLLEKESPDYIARDPQHLKSIINEIFHYD